MSYVIQSPRATFRSLREAIDTTQLTRDHISRLCRTAGSGWSMCKHGGSRSDADRFQKQRAQQERLATADSAVKPVHTDHLADMVAEMRELRGEVARLRSEVVELTVQATNMLTLPPGTQLNLPLYH